MFSENMVNTHHGIDAVQDRLSSTEKFRNAAEEAAWEQQAALFRSIEKAGGMQPYTKALSLLFEEPFAKTFENDGVIGCVDERVECGLHSAGSLFLLDDEQKAAYIKESGAKSITWHAGCGAMAAAYRSVNGLPANEPVSPDVVDAFAEEETRKIAEKFGLEFLGKIAAGHPRWHGDRDKHLVRSIYYTAAKADMGFNPYACPGMPVGFVINAACLDPEVAVYKTGFVRDIAFGGHGFGRDHFSEDEQLRIIPVASSEEQLQELTSMLKEKFPDPVYRIEGFVAPTAI